MSSVRGLNARPHSAKVLPLRLLPKCRVTFSTRSFFWRSLTSSTARSRGISSSGLEPEAPQREGFALETLAEVPRHIFHQKFFLAFVDLLDRAEQRHFELGLARSEE